MLSGAGWAAGSSDGQDEIVTRFLSADREPLISYRATRQLEASTRGGKMTASMHVLTTLDPDHGFSYSVLNADGSPAIQKKLFLPALEAEREMRASSEVDRGALTLANYAMAADGRTPEGLERIRLIPSRSDKLLLNGQLLVTPTDADLVSVEGRPVRRPSFWTRRVSIVRHYSRVDGVQVPVSMQSTADVLVVGKSMFHMTYHYESINGRPVSALASAIAGAR